MIRPGRQVRYSQSFLKIIRRDTKESHMEILEQAVGIATMFNENTKRYLTYWEDVDRPIWIDQEDLIFVL